MQPSLKNTNTTSLDKPEANNDKIKSLSQVLNELIEKVDCGYLTEEQPKCGKRSTGIVCNVDGADVESLGLMLEAGLDVACITFKAHAVEGV